MRIKFLHLRSVVLIYIIKLLTFLFAVEFPPIPSVGAIIKKGSKILFVDLSYLNGLGIPGGIVQSGETLEEALKREVHEETKLKVKEITYFGSEKSSYKGISTVSTVFLVKVSGTEKSSEEGKLVWLEPRKAMGRFAYKNTEAIFAKYMKKYG
jgi:ADP-ribose pyrophosphatase YjhB (NUDIX family)